MKVNINWKEKKIKIAETRNSNEILGTHKKI